ncbi:MAG TPA: ABC transporter substrate-binding protein [Ilumatobacteraceae bacterium]|nr:ABC transporter substrate-binding protein [Ilumatobacteraceae bacterium]
MNTHSRRFGRRLLGAVAGLALITAACGSDDSSSSGSGSTDPTVAETTVADVAAPEPTAPDDTAAASEGESEGAGQRVVSLSPTHTEMMFAIGAGDQLVAVDQFSDYPADALALPNELSAFDNNVEAIAAYEPDLVLIGGDFSGLGPQLDELGIAWWDGPAASTIDDTYRQIEELGDATGRDAEADALVASMQAEIDEIVAATPVPAEPLTVFHELDDTLFSIDSTTLFGELYGLLGLRNIADTAEGDSGGYPQLNAEFVVSADPDFIFLADTKCCGQSLDTVAARDGWADMTAVRNGNVLELDDDVASRWGPRIVDFLRAVSDAVTAAS